MQNWIKEAVYHPRDSHCGARITQLTAQTTMATSIYCEDPYCSEACGRIVVFRSHNTEMNAPAELWVLDPVKLCSMLIDRQASFRGCAQHAYGDFFFYLRYSGRRRELVRLCLSTLASEVVLSLKPDHPGYFTVGSMSPNNRYYVNGIQTSTGLHQVVVVDLTTREETVIAEAEDLVNPHPRFDRMEGEYVMVQHNQGQRLDPKGCGMITFHAGGGPTLFVVRRDGSGRQELPVAKPHIPVPTGVSGHEAWIKGQPEVLISLMPGSVYEDGGKKGNLLLVRLSDKLPRVVIHDPDIYYGHVSTSRCGRYWVCDIWNRGNFGVAPAIVVGSVRTGKKAVVCDAGGYWPTFEVGHTHPYLTADNKRIVFGSTRTGTPQVYAAELPNGLWESLE